MLGRDRRNAINAVNDLKASGWVDWIGTKGGSSANTNAFRLILKSGDEFVTSPSDEVDTSDNIISSDNFVRRGDELVPDGVMSSPHEPSIEPSRTRARARATPIPDDFELDDETFNRAIELLGDADKVASSIRRFRDHHLQVAGDKGLSRDWMAKARLWIDDDAKRAKSSPFSLSKAAVQDDKAWDDVVSHYKRTGNWTRHVDMFGPDPESIACRVPRYILAKHGLAERAA